MAAIALSTPSSLLWTVTIRNPPFAELSYNFFFRRLKLISSFISAINYVTVGLICVNFDLFKRLSEDFIQCGEERRLFLLELEVSRCYFKYNFDLTL